MCTLPKSSAEASRDPSCDLHTALISVPSAPSGHIPERSRERARERWRLKKVRKKGETYSQTLKFHQNAKCLI